MTTLPPTSVILSPHPGLLRLAQEVRVARGSSSKLSLGHAQALDSRLRRPRRGTEAPSPNAPVLSSVFCSQVPAHTPALQSLFLRDICSRHNTGTAPHYIDLHSLTPRIHEYRVSDLQRSLPVLQECLKWLKVSLLLSQNTRAAPSLGKPKPRKERN